MKKIIFSSLFVLLDILFLLLPAYLAVPLMVPPVIISGPVYQEELYLADGSEETRTYQLFLDLPRGESCSVRLENGDVPHIEGSKTTRPGCTPINLTRDSVGFRESDLRLLALILVSPIWGMLVFVLFVVSYPRVGKRILLRLYLAVKIHSRKRRFTIWGSVGKRANKCE